MNKIIITNTTVIDGSGSSPYKSDVLISGDRIAKTGRIGIPDGALVIDGTGLVCCPGFIDVHTHSDISLVYCGDPSGHVLQGVTSEVIGNCGYSPFPLKNDPAFIKKRRASLSLIDTELVDWDWRSFEEYRRQLVKGGVNENIRILVGYGSIRAFVMDYEDRRPTPSEQTRIGAILRETLEAGACGLSVGLGYAPDFYADTDELILAAKIVKQTGGIMAFHIRGERKTLFTAVSEVIRIAEATGVRTEVSHLKCAGSDNMGRMNEVLAMIDAANARGCDISFDVYPYTAGCSYLGLVFPPKYHEGGLDKLLERLSDRTQLPEILHDMEYGYPGWSTFIGEHNGENLLITSTKSGASTGKTVAELGRERNITPYQAAAALMLENDGIVEMVMFQTSQEDVDMAINHPLAMFGSDSMAMDPIRARLRERPHPRYYGAFSKLLAENREKQIMPVERLIHKMTGQPAERFGFTQRGLIKEGYFADMCLFSPDEISSPANYSDPNRLSAGMRYVLVNGVFTVKDGKAQTARPGRVLS